MPGDVSLNNLMARPVSKDATTDALKQRDRLKKATQEFEAVFVGQLLKEMRKSMTPGNKLLGSSRESKQFQEMFDDSLSRDLSHNGSFGLAKVLYKRMEKWIPPLPVAAPSSPPTLSEMDLDREIENVS